MSTNYGYIRVSTKDQNEARQVDAMLAAGIPEKNLYIDKASGKDFDREQYVRMIRRLKMNDVVFIHSLDRLGRNYAGIIEEWNAITKRIHADIVVMDMPILDTRQGKDLMGTLISDIVLQLLSYVAQTEREKIKTRQAEGIAAAKARGVRFGRPATPVPEGFSQARLDWRNGRITADEAAAKVGMNRKTFYNRVKCYERRMKGDEENG